MKHISPSLLPARAIDISSSEFRYCELTDLALFTREILLKIQGVSLGQLVRATGLSVRYVSQIRGGENVPHPQPLECVQGCTFRAAG
jgi:hypothetical protein